MIVSGGGDIMAGCGWLRLMEAKLWLVMGAGGKIMAGNEWSSVVARFINAH